MPPSDAKSSGNPAAKQQGVLARYEPVIGLEVHCQLKTASKLFCSCSTQFGALPNHHTCPVCLGLPGVLPVVNGFAVDCAIKMALAVNADVHEISVFARKQYFYPDLPKGYQITQFDRPYCTGGGVKLSTGQFVRLNRIHLEEDAGKNIHEGDSSFIDLNRAGTPLIEIVTEPDIHSAEDAADYLRRLRSLARALDISDGNLEEGSFRCDANVSLRPRGTKPLGKRCEIKNLNSFKNIERAIRYEIMRQADLLDQSQEIVQQTRLFDAASGKTQTMRSKEESHDYRYFPDPDLLPLMLSSERIAKLKSELPELPEAKVRRYVEQMGLTEYDATSLTGDRDLAVYFETVVAAVGDGVSAKAVANWLLTEFLRQANEGEWDLADSPVSTDASAQLLTMVASGTISNKIAKKVFREMVESGENPSTIVERKGLQQISDASAIRALVVEVLQAHPEQVSEYRGGKKKVYGFFVGQIMSRCGGKMNPETVNGLLREELERPSEES